jgi:hypothetical protein
MFIVQILLPLYDNAGTSFPDSLASAIRAELVTKFGGVTAFTRTPAEGVWAYHGMKIRDEIVLVEVMTEVLDRPWWRDFRRRLESYLRQDSIVIRAQQSETL